MASVLNPPVTGLPRQLAPADPRLREARLVRVGLPLVLLLRGRSPRRSGRAPSPTSAARPTAAC